MATAVGQQRSGGQLTAGPMGVRLPPELRQRCLDHMAATGRSFSDLARLAIYEHLQRLQQQQPRQGKVGGA